MKTLFRFGLLGPILVLHLFATDPAHSQDVTYEHVSGNIWRIDGAVDVIGAQMGPDGLFIVDTGYPFAEQGVRSALRAIAGTSEPAKLINTHVHHGFSNHLYGKGAEIIAHERTAERMKSGFLMAGTIVPEFEEEGYPNVVFTDSMRFHMNGEDISVIHFPGAHTDSDAVVIFHGSNVVMAGDLFVSHMPWISLDEGASYQGLLSALDRLIEIIPKDAKIIPGHDPVTLGKRDLYSFKEMIVSAADTVKARMDAGMTLRHIKTRGLPHLASWRGAVPEALFIESLGGGFVVPPFGEAHTHQLGQLATLDEDAASFISAGVYYAMVQDPIAELTDEHDRLSARVDQPDVSYTQGIVTPSWGVITDFYQMMVDMGQFGDGTTLDELDGKLLFRIDSLADVDEAWPALEAVNDRFIKVMVAFSGEIDKRRADPQTFAANPPQFSAKPGVLPDVLTELVKRAHDAGLEVSAHIETAADFRLAVNSGVDWIAHMPASWQVGEGTGYDAGNLEPWLLTQEDAMAARMSGTKVVTTLVPWFEDDPRAAAFREVHSHNFGVLVDVGSTLIIGSDFFGGSAIEEVLYLRSLDVLSDEQLFRLLAVQTPRAIFPDLKIGHLRDGWEASFLVLRSDPTRQLEAVRDIQLRVKRGMILE